MGLIRRQRFSADPLERKVELGMLPIARRDVERLQQIIAIQPQAARHRGAGARRSADCCTAPSSTKRSPGSRSTAIGPRSSRTGASSRRRQHRSPRTPADAPATDARRADAAVRRRRRRRRRRGNYGAQILSQRVASHAERPIRSVLDDSAVESSGRESCRARRRTDSRRRARSAGASAWTDPARCSAAAAR